MSFCSFFFIFFFVDQHVEFIIILNIHTKLSGKCKMEVKIGIFKRKRSLALKSKIKLKKSDDVRLQEKAFGSPHIYRQSVSRL